MSFSAGSPRLSPPTPAGDAVSLSLVRTIPGATGLDPFQVNGQNRDLVTLIKTLTLAGTPGPRGDFASARVMGDAWGESVSAEEREPLSSRMQQVVREVKGSAEAVTQTAGEFRGLLGDVRELLKLKPPYGGIDAVGGRFDSVVEKLRGIVTYAGVWGALLMALLFVLMLLYRAIMNRFLTVRSAT